MGANKKEMERMRYVIFTEPLTDMEAHEHFLKPQKDFIRDWSREPDDYIENFKNDEEYKKINALHKETKKAKEQYKENKRKQLNK